MREILVFSFPPFLYRMFRRLISLLSIHKALLSLGLIAVSLAVASSTVGPIALSGATRAKSSVASTAIISIPTVYIKLTIRVLRIVFIIYIYPIVITISVLDKLARGIPYLSCEVRRKGSLEVGIEFLSLVSLFKEGTFEFRDSLARLSKGYYKRGFAYKLRS